MNNNKIVFDTSVILAVINREPGMEVALPLLESAIINTVTFAEFVTKLAERGLSETEVQEILAKLGVEIVSFDEDQALLAGMLRPTTMRFGLSLGDRACLALGLSRNLPVLTADRNWTRVSLDVDLRLIR